MLPAIARTSLDLLEAFAHIEDLETLKRETSAFAGRLGFTVSGVAGVTEVRKGPTRHRLERKEEFWQLEVTSAPGDHAVLRMIDDAPPGFRISMDRFYDARLDPVNCHTKHSHLPLIWDQGTYVRAGAADLWDVQAQFGMKNGVAVGVHLPKGRHVCYGFDREDPIETGERQQLLAHFQLVATYALEPAINLLTIPAAQTGDADHQLSTRELECLKWTAEGKTAYEVALILNLSESRVSKVLAAASHRLGCVNKQQAAAKAVRLGILR